MRASHDRPARSRMTSWKRSPCRVTSVGSKSGRSRTSGSAMTGTLARRGPGGSQPERLLQPDGQAGMVEHPPHAEHDTRHERLPRERVVADGEGLAVAAEQHLLVRDEPGQADRMDAHTVDVRA